MTFTTEAQAVLKEYANRLLASGFTVWVPDAVGWTFIAYGRKVDGDWRTGTVERDETLEQRWRHLMVLTPSKEYGSAMHVHDVPVRSWLSVDDAKKITRVVNRNDVIGTRPNGGLPEHFERWYTKYIPGEEVI